MAEVILVQPKIGTWDLARTAPTPPLALLSAARLVSERYETVFIDQRMLGWKNKLKKAVSKKTLCITTTSFISTSIKNAVKISKYAKEISDVPVVWGGVAATLLSETILNEDFVDIVVRGEGEITFKEIVDALHNKKSLKNIKGCWFKEKEKIIKNPDRNKLNLNEMPDIPYYLIDLNKYLPKEGGLRKLLYESSKGCINACAYCFNKPFNNSQWRYLSAERVIKDIKDIIKKYPAVEQIYFVDSNFFINKERALKISDGIGKLGLTWSTEGGHVEFLNRFNDEELRKMKRDGCKLIYCGADSGSERILKLCNRNMKIENVIKINRRMKGIGIRLRFNFMVGFPSETLEDIKKTIRLIFQLKEENPNTYISLINVLLLSPNSKIYNKELSMGYKPPQSIGGWSNISTGYVDLPWISEKRKRLLKKIYRNSYFLNKKHHIDLPFYFRVLLRIYNPIAEYTFKQILKIKENNN